mgnify:CR=1 FL=1
MRTLTTLLASLFLVALAGGAIYGTIWGGESLWSWLGALDPATRKLALFFGFIAIACASLLGIALRVAAGRLARRDIDASRLSAYRTVLSQADCDHRAVEADLSLLASPEVLEKYDLLRLAQAQGMGSDAARTELVRAMRQDLGLRAGPMVTEVSGRNRPLPNTLVQAT